MPSFPCSADDGQTAGYLLTDLTADETINLCPGHMAGWAAAYVEAFAAANAVPDEQPELQPEPQDLAEADDAAPAPAPGRRTRKPRPTGNPS